MFDQRSRGNRGMIANEPFSAESDALLNPWATAATTRPPYPRGLRNKMKARLEWNGLRVLYKEATNDSIIVRVFIFGG